MAQRKTFHFRMSGGFADTKMYERAEQARKYAQKLARDLGRVVTYYVSGGVHHKVKPPKSNPRAGKKYRIVPGGGTSSTVALARKKAKAYSRRTDKLVSVLDPNGMVLGQYENGVAANPCKGKKPAGAKPKKPGKANPRIRLMYGTRGQLPRLRKLAKEDATRTGQAVLILTQDGKKLALVKPGAAQKNKPAGELGDWIDVKKAKQVRVRKLKGGVVKLDIKT